MPRPALFLIHRFGGGRAPALGALFLPGALPGGPPAHALARAGSYPTSGRARKTHQRASVLASGWTCLAALVLSY